MSVILRLGELEELDCSGVRKDSSGRDCYGMVFPPSSVCSGGLSAVRAFFASDFVDIDLKGVEVRFQDVAQLGDALEAVVVRSIDLSGSTGLGTPGVARLLEWAGSGVKSVNMKGTGLGLAAGLTYQSFSSRASCGDCDWGRLEGALRGLAALDAIDLSDNKALLTSGVGRLVSCCAGEEFAFVVVLLVFVGGCDPVSQGACGG